LCISLIRALVPAISDGESSASLWQMAMALHVAADHRAVEDVHRGEQLPGALIRHIEPHGVMALEIPRLPASILGACRLLLEHVAALTQQIGCLNLGRLSYTFIGLKYEFRMAHEHVAAKARRTLILASMIAE
jgi:hypothetical protein